MERRRSSPEPEAHTGRLSRTRPFRTPLAALWWLLAAACSLATPDPAIAQSFLGFGGAEVRGGRAEVANVKGADLTTNLSVESDIGYVGVPSVRTIFGVNLFTGDVAAETGPLRPSAEGTMRSVGAGALIRWDFRGKRRLSPYILAGATVDYVESDAGDRQTDSTLDGSHLGGQFGGGVAFRLGNRHHWSLTTDFRGVTSKEIGRMLLTIGLRYSPRGQAMYDIDDIPSARPTTIIDGPPGRPPPYR